MQYAKVIASILVAVMVITPAAMFSATDAETEDSTDICDTGTVNVYLYTDTDTYCETVKAFDLYQAVVAASSSLGITTEAAEVYDDITDVTYDGSQWIYDFGSYTDINPYYGEIDTITYGNTTYTSNSNDGYPSFEIYVSDGENDWAVAADAIGWYRPFADYASTVTFDGTKSAGASNIAIVLSDSVSVDTLNGLNNLQKLTDVDRDDAAYRYTFYLKNSTKDHVISVSAGTTVIMDNDGIDEEHVLTTDELREGITIVGYGSDAYLALMNALGDDVSGQTQIVLVNDSGYNYYYTFYSWMDEIFDEGTVTIVDEGESYIHYTYYYWSSYYNQYVNSDGETVVSTDDGESGYVSYLNYTLGYYSKLAGAYNQILEDTSFMLSYEVSEYCEVSDN